MPRSMIGTTTSVSASPRTPEPVQLELPGMPAPDPTRKPAPDEMAPVVLYFGGSYPMRHRAETLHAFLAKAEEAMFRALLKDRYDPEAHFDCTLVDHAALTFGKWKGTLRATVRQLAGQLPPGHYIVSPEERIQVLADALLPLVHAVGGPR